MTNRRHLLKGWVGAVGLAIAGCAPKPNLQTLNNVPPGQRMRLDSAAFAANAPIPARYTCDGENVSPPLGWDAPPASTRSLALIVEDPDAPTGAFAHWLIFNLPPDLRQLPEKVPPLPTLPGGATQGRNDFGRLGYSGPCPPDGTHHYFFRLYALDARMGLPPETGKNQLLQAMTGHILGGAELVGVYSRR
jgi:Raf kinase inhibitor-like YbhB/YbcL family protein